MQFGNYRDNLKKTVNMRVISVLASAEIPSSDESVRDVAIYSLSRLAQEADTIHYLTSEALSLINSGI
jgi:hypothetical protein